MTDLETQVLRILSTRVRRAWAIRAQAIAEMVGVTEGEVREAIKTLIEVYGQAICATTEKPYGYFFPGDAEEGEQYAAPVKSRIKSDQERLNALERNLLTKFGPQRELGI